MTVVPPDPKTPYLMKTEVITAEESPDGKLTWNLLLSSSHLIEEFLKDGQEELICMDHTHSLCVENCPVMFVGRVSRAGHFCPFGIVIGNKEAASNSKFVLEWIRDNCSVPPRRRHCGRSCCLHSGAQGDLSGHVAPYVFFPRDEECKR